MYIRNEFKAYLLFYLCDNSVSRIIDLFWCMMAFKRKNPIKWNSEFLNSKFNTLEHIMNVKENGNKLDSISNQLGAHS